MMGVRRRFAAHKMRGLRNEPDLFDNSTRWRHWVLRIPTSSLAVETLRLVQGKRVPYKYTLA